MSKCVQVEHCKSAFKPALKSHQVSHAHICAVWMVVVWTQIFCRDFCEVRALLAAQISSQTFMKNSAQSLMTTCALSPFMRSFATSVAVDIAMVHVPVTHSGALAQIFQLKMHIHPSWQHWAKRPHDLLVTSDCSCAFINSFIFFCV